MSPCNKRAAVTVMVTANGYTVQSGYREQGDMSHIFVFATFESMCKWLKDNLQKPCVDD